METEVEEIRRAEPGRTLWTGWWVDGAGTARFVSEYDERRALRETHAGIIQHGVTVARDSGRHPGARLAPVSGLGICLAAGIAPHSTGLVAEVRLLAANLAHGLAFNMGVSVTPTSPATSAAAMRALGVRVRNELNRLTATDDEVVSIVGSLVSRSEDLDGLRAALRDALGGGDALEGASDAELCTLVELLDPSNIAELLEPVRALLGAGERILSILEGGDSQ